jgi:ATP-dependent helicase/nuclease subunit A
LIHRLLQSLPEVEPQERKAVAQRFLALPQHGLSAEEQADVQQEVLRLIEHPQFAPLFSSDGHAEVPIVGVVEGQRIEGQVDRLAYVGQEIWIVDYKTNRPPPSDSAGIPAIYRAQMEAYRRVLRLIYPARPVRCFLLWTYGARLMDMDA